MAVMARVNEKKRLRRFKSSAFQSAQKVSKRNHFDEGDSPRGKVPVNPTVNLRSDGFSKVAECVRKVGSVENRFTRQQGKGV